MNKSKFVIFFIVISMLILSVVQSVVANRLSTSGLSMDKIEQEINYYKTENALLSEKLFLASSLTAIEAKALDLGFVEEKLQYVVTAANALAIGQ